MKKWVWVCCVLLIAEVGEAQRNDYVFKDLSRACATSVKSQGATGTCWSFASSSFIESEAIRLGRDTLDVSEMFFVRYAYPRKLTNYLGNKGKAKYGEGGLAHDIKKLVSAYGIVPQSVYGGRAYTGERYNHKELNAVLEGFAKGLVSCEEHTNVWMKAYEAILNTYLGVPPSTFLYREKWYSPQTFAREVVGFVPEDYVEIGSMEAFAYYSQFVLDVPDNWDKTGEYYNVPPDELIQIMDYALTSGFTIDWDGDVSEPGFMYEKGLAIFPEREITPEQVDSLGLTFEKERVITPKERQKLFDTKKTTDDHLMHITGLAEDERGMKYYITKNSWGKSNENGGFLYMSECYAKAKTVAILVHKDAIPPKIRKRMGL